MVDAGRAAGAARRGRSGQSQTARDLDRRVRGGVAAAVADERLPAVLLLHRGRTVACLVRDPSRHAPCRAAHRCGVDGGHRGADADSPEIQSRPCRSRSAPGLRRDPEFQRRHAVVRRVFRVHGSLAVPAAIRPRAGALPGCDCGAAHGGLSCRRIPAIGATGEAEDHLVDGCWRGRGICTGGARNGGSRALESECRAIHALRRTVSQAVVDRDRHRRGGNRVVTASA